MKVCNLRTKKFYNIGPWNEEVTESRSLAFEHLDGDPSHFPDFTTHSPENSVAAAHLHREAVGAAENYLGFKKTW
jgi:hypothetical protein